jgi:arabinose-5-phosphate isomerase
MPSQTPEGKKAKEAGLYSPAMIKGARGAAQRLSDTQTDATPTGAMRAPLDLARRVLAIEAEAVHALIERLDERFLAAVALILGRRGRVVVSGIGKSGHIARKVASTLSSTGTPAYFIHPAEASHGDLGMIEREDVLIAISRSGESEELLRMVPLVKRRGAKLIALTGRSDSALAQEADVHLDCGVAQEACPLNLAPTASTTAALALGDALAVALLDARGFSADDFARSHPGGALGRRLLTHVSDVMRRGPDVPSVPEAATLKQAVLEMSRGRMGMTAVLDREGRVSGIFTDGDLRRTLEKLTDFGTARIAQVMTAAPRVIAPEALAVEAVQIMDEHKVNQLLVVDPDGRLIGALNMHDLFRAKVI